MSPFARPMLAAIAILAAALAALARTPEPPLASDEVSAVELAEWIRARRPGLSIVDARPIEAPARDGLPGARALAEVDAGAADTVVVYDEGPLGDFALPVGSARVLRLRGGLAAWNAEVMFPTLRSDAGEGAKKEFAARAELSRYFGGSPRVIAPGATSGGARSRRGC